MSNSIVKFYMYNRNIRCYNMPSELYDYLYQFLSYRPKGYQFMEKYRSGLWDGRISLIQRKDKYDVFPSGLWEYVKKILDEIKLDYELIDKRKKPEREFNWKWNGKELRDYQKTAVRKVLEKERGILYMATGSGKTVVATRIIYELGMRTLFLVNTKEALYQTKEEIESSLGIKVGMYGAGIKKIKPITVGLVAGIYRNLQDLKDELKKFNVLIIDEAHHSAANSWYLVTRWVNAYYRIGITGTAIRTDNKDLLLYAATGEVIYKMKAKKLAEKGYLMSPEVRFIRVKEGNIFGVDYNSDYSDGIVKNEIRNKYIVDIFKKHYDEGKSILVIIDRIEHGMGIKKLLKGYNVEFISGSSMNREKLMRDFRNKKLQGVIATKIYNESVDIPIIEILILGAGGKSPINTIQRIGRALRKAPGKEKVIIYDFLDEFSPRLSKHSAERLKTCKREGFDIKKLSIEEVLRR